MSRVVLTTTNLIPNLNLGTFWGNNIHHNLNNSNLSSFVKWFYGLRITSTFCVFALAESRDAMGHYLCTGASGSDKDTMLHPTMQCSCQIKFFAESPSPPHAVILSCLEALACLTVILRKPNGRSVSSHFHSVQQKEAIPHKNDCSLHLLHSAIDTSVFSLPVVKMELSWQDTDAECNFWGCSWSHVHISESVFFCSIFSGCDWIDNLLLL